MSKIAIFSDLHLGIHNNSTEWHQIALEWSDWFVSELDKREIKTIVFCGDYYHNRDVINVLTLNVGIEIVNKLLQNGRVLHMLTGNHCNYFKSRTDVHSLSIFKGRHNVHIYDTLQYINLDGRTAAMVPWGVDINTLHAADILFGHLEIETFKMNDYTPCLHGINVLDLIKHSKNVVSGHFHYHNNREVKGKNVLYCGNPFQMDFGDSNNTKGIYLYDTDTENLEFIENTLSPKYHKIDLSALIKIPKRVSEIFKNNYVKLTLDLKITPEHVTVLFNKLQSYGPRNITPDFQNFDYIISSNQAEANVGVTIPEAAKEMLDALNLPSRDEIYNYIIDIYNKYKTE